MEEKDLEKFTATKLREIAKQYEGITGVHAMKKEDLIREIRKARGEPERLVTGDTKDLGKIKKHLRGLKGERQAAQEKNDKKAVTTLRKKIKKYRRLTRKLAKTKA